MSVPSTPQSLHSTPRGGRGPHRGGRIDTNNYEIRRRVPNKPQLAPNHFYLSSKSNIEREANRIENLLRNDMREIYIHGMGESIVMAISVATLIEKRMGPSITMSTRTNTVTVKDDLYPLSEEADYSTRSRPLSAIQMKLVRLSPL